MQERKNYLIIIIASVLGLISGLVANLFTRAYLEDYLAQTIFGEINYSNNNYRSGGLIIREAKNVVVEHNDKVREVVNSSIGSLMFIYPKKEKKQTSTSSLENYYLPGKEYGQATAITSDGWLITKSKIEKINDYVIVSSDKKIYPIVDIVKDSATSFIFLRIKNNNLPVKKFLKSNNVFPGQQVVAVSSDGSAAVSSILSIKEKNNLIKSSDISFDKIKLSSDNIKKHFTLFSLSGDILGFNDDSGLFDPVWRFEAAINSLLKNGIIKRPSLGVNYIPAYELISSDEGKVIKQFEKGAIIYFENKNLGVENNSPAFLSGLKEGDLIISVEDIEINKDNDLVDIIQRFSPEDMITLFYERNSFKKEIKIKLGELK